MDNVHPEICTIRIMFPVTSDEQALDCKKRIRESLKDIPDVQTQFSIMDTPIRPNALHV